MCITFVSQEFQFWIEPIIKRMNTKREKAKDSTLVAKELEDEYRRIMQILEQNASEITHEWNRQGDTFKECTFYSQNRSILTTHTNPL